VLPLSYGFLFVAITFFSTMIGGIFTLRRSGVNINMVFAFAAGALIGISFFDLLPESISISMNTGIGVSLLMSVVVVAFLVFHTLDQCILCLHTQKEGRLEHAPQFSGIIKASGLSLHSFLDGVAIGTAFYVGLELGLVVAFAVVFHDFSDGLNTVTVMLRSGSTQRTAFSWLVLDSVTPLLGAAVTLLAAIPLWVIGLVLAFFAGEFIYLGATDLLPEAHRHENSLKLLLATVLGMLVIFATTHALRL
jgi:ZIP family zinc transporter